MKFLIALVTVVYLSAVTATGHALPAYPTKPVELVVFRARLNGDTLLTDVHATAWMLFATQSDVPFTMEDKNLPLATKMGIRK